MISAGEGMPATSRMVHQAGVTSVNLEDALDLNGNRMRQRDEAYGAARANAAIRSPDLRKQLRAAVDDGRVIAEVGRRLHHTKQLHDPRDAIQRAERQAQRREDGQAGL